MTPIDLKLMKRRERLHVEFCKIQSVFSKGGTLFPRNMTKRQAHFRLHELDDSLRQIDETLFKVIAH